MAKKGKGILKTNKEMPRVILVGNASHDYHRGLLRGTANYCNNNRTWETHIEQPLPVSKLFELAKSWRIDGAIMYFYGMIDNKADPSYVQDIGKLSSSLDIPILVTAPPTKKYKQLGFINANNIYTGTIAAEYYMEKGFKSYAFCGYKNIQWSRERFKGYRETLQTKGHTVSVYEQDYAGVLKKRREEILNIAGWLKQLIPPVALFVCHDELAMHVAEACKLIDLKVPQDIGILGVDNDDVKCGLFNPSLSSIAVNTELAGYEAAELLEKLMKRQKVESNLILVQPKYVVERQSSDINAIDDPVVAEAVAYITQNANKPIGVEDVLEEVLVPRRTLERKFHKLLGNTIYKEIQNERIKRVERMLLETDMSIREIAHALNFSDPNELSRFFKRMRKTSPLSFRKKQKMYVSDNETGRAF